jgi:hypothetical protein
MDEPDTELDRQVAQLSKDFAEGVRSLASSPSLRDGLLRACFNDLVWELYFAFPESRFVLEDELEGLASAVRASAAEDREKAAAEKAKAMLEEAQSS